MSNKPLRFLFCLAILLLGLNTSSQQLEFYEDAGEKLEPPLGYLSPSMIELLTLGHKRLYDDLLYLWLLQYLIPAPGQSLEAVEQLNGRILNVLKFKPAIESLYLLACFVLAMQLQRPDLCLAVTSLGVEAQAESWRIPFTQGYIYAFLLGQPARAAFFYHLASKRPDSPSYLEDAAKKLLSENKLTVEDMEESLKLMTSLPGVETFKDFFRHLHPASPEHGRPY